MQVIQFIISLSILLTLFTQLIEFNKKLICHDKELLKSIKSRYLDTVDNYNPLLKLKIHSDQECQFTILKNKKELKIISTDHIKSIHFKLDGKISNDS